MKNQFRGGAVYFAFLLGFVGFFWKASSGGVSFHFEPPKGWIVSSQNALQVWHDPSDKKLAIVVVTDSSKSPYFIDEKTPQKFLNSMMDARKKMNSIFGLTNYTVKNWKFNKTREGYVISLEGEFYGHDKRWVGFKERQFYRGQNFYQITLNYDETKAKIANQMYETWISGLTFTR